MFPFLVCSVCACVKNRISKWSKSVEFWGRGRGTYIISCPYMHSGALFSVARPAPPPALPTPLPPPPLDERLCPANTGVSDCCPPLVPVHHERSYLSGATQSRVPLQCVDVRHLRSSSRLLSMSGFP